MVTGQFLLHSLADPTPLYPGILTRISGEFVHEVVDINGQILLATDTGAYRIDEGDELVQISPQKNVVVMAIAKIGGGIWLGTEKGLLEIRGADSRHIFEEALRDLLITEIRAVGEVVWLGTSGGLIAIENGGLSRTSIREQVEAVEWIDGTLWVGTTRNAYRLTEAGGLEGVLPKPTMVSRIEAVGEDVWLVTNRGPISRYGPCIRFDGEQARTPEALRDLGVISVADVGGEPWFGTIHGVVNLEGGSPSRLPAAAPTEPINAIEVVKGEVWLGSTERAYREVGGTFWRIPEEAQALNIKGILRTAGGLWLWGETGAYRYEENLEIRITPTTHKFFGTKMSLGRMIGIREACYFDRGSLSSCRPSDFSVVLQWRQDEFDKELASDHFVPASSLTRIVPVGLQTLYLIGRDSVGNTTQRETHSVLVLPILPILMPVLFWLAALLLFVLAPFSTPVMNLLMIPAVRRLGSLWAIPFFLAFAPFRWHLLRRYTSELRESCSVQGWLDLDDTPPWESKILDELAARHQSQVTGDLSVTRRFLRFLACQFASGEIDRLGRVVPIFLRLELHTKDLEDLEQGAQLQLRNFGGITDPELARTILARGGFVFLLDGWGRIDDPGRVAVEKFIEGYEKRNYIVVGSDEKSNKVTPKGELAISERVPAPPEVAEPESYSGHFSCFISYSHEDRDFAQQLYEELTQRHIRTWRDEEDMKTGEKILDAVISAIRQHDKVLLCCSENSLSSSYVHDEITAAIEREREEGREILIPLALDDYLFEDWSSSHAPRIRERLAGDFIGWKNDAEKFRKQIVRLVKALEIEPGGGSSENNGS